MTEKTAAQSFAERERQSQSMIEHHDDFMGFIAEVLTKNTKRWHDPGFVGRAILLPVMEIATAAITKTHPIVADVFVLLQDIRAGAGANWPSTPQQAQLGPKQAPWLWKDLKAQEKFNTITEKYTVGEGDDKRQRVSNLEWHHITALISRYITNTNAIDAAERARLKAIGTEDNLRENIDEILGDIAETQQFILMKEFIERETNLYPRGSSFTEALQLSVFTLDVSKNKRSSSAELYSKIITNKYDPKFLTITNAQWSLLVPKISLKQVFIKRERGQFKIQSEKTKKYVFLDHLHPDSLQNLTSDKIGRGDGVGLKSVSIEHRQEHFADKRYFVKISIFFENAQTLYKQHLLSKSAAKKQDDSSTAKKKNKAAPTQVADFIDLLSLTQEIKKDGGSEFWRWYLTFGWATPPAGAIVGDKGDKIREFVAKLQTTLVLNLWRWQFKFNQDGSVVLDVEFVADDDERQSSDILIAKEDEVAIARGKTRYEDSVIGTKAAKKALDAFNKTGKLTALKKALKAAGIDEKKYNDFKKRASLSGEKALSADEKKEFDLLRNKRQHIINQRSGGTDFAAAHEKLMQDYNNALNDQAIKKSFYSKYIYSNFTNRLMRTNKIHVGVAERTFLSEKKGTAAAMNYRFYPMYKIAASEAVVEVLGGRANTAHQASSAAATADAAGAKSSGGKDKLRKDAMYNLLKGHKKLLRELKYKPKGKPTDSIVIPYFFAGDIIDIAFGNHNSRAGKSIKPVLASLDLSMNRRRDAIKAAKSFPDKRNISNIPISFTSFMLWWNNKVVRSQKEVWPLRIFLREFFDEFLNKIIDNYDPLHKKYLGVEPDKKVWNNTDADITIESVDMPYDLTGRKFRKKGENFVIDVDKVLRARGRGGSLAASPTAHEASPDNLFSHMFIYGTAGRIWLNCVPKENMQSGIYHFFVGGDGGIMKSIEFNVVPSEWRRTTQLLDAVKEKRDPNFVEQYDVTIRMRGNNIIKPGVLIYVDLSLIGFGKSNQPNTISYEHNLGGYYLMYKVDHQVSGDDFETVIVARTDGFSGKGLIKTGKEKKAKN